MIGQSLTNEHARIITSFTVLSPVGYNIHILPVSKDVSKAKHNILIVKQFVFNIFFKTYALLE